MKKEELKKLLKTDFRIKPFKIEDETTALELAEIGLNRYGISDPDEILRSNAVMRDWLEEKVGRERDREEKEERINKALDEQAKIKILTGLEEENNIDKLKDDIYGVEYVEKMKVALGMKEKFDKEEVKKEVQERARQLKEDEALEKEAEIGAKKWFQKYGKEFMEEVSKLSKQK